MKEYTEKELLSWNMRRNAESIEYFAGLLVKYTDNDTLAMSLFCAAEIKKLAENTLEILEMAKCVELRKEMK